MSALDGILSGANDPTCVLYGTDDPYFDLHDRQEATAELSAIRAENARMREALVAARRHILCDDGCEAFKRDWIGNRFETRKCSCGADTAFDLARAALGGRDD